MIDPLSLSVAGVAAAAVFATFVRGVVHPRSSILGRVRWHGDRTAPRVALTFDDGPHPDATPAILDALADHDVRAAFFVIGRHAERWPHLIRRIATEGHLIGNHSHDHHHWGMLGSARYWRDQIDRTQTLLDEIAGVRPLFFRPPMGLKSPSLARALRDCGLQQVTFTVRGYDGFQTTPERILERMAPVAAPGDILTLHDGRDPWVDRPRLAARDAIAPLVRRLRERGLEPVRLDSLLEAPAAERAASPSESPSARDLPVGT